MLRPILRNIDTGQCYTGPITDIIDVVGGTNVTVDTATVGNQNCFHC